MAPRWECRPVTRFERRGLDAGRPIVELCYRRRP
jgi:tRNA (guanine-N7-)-methyltransferase